ncbi:MAG: hypothetical protein ACNYZG_11805, partial [Gammaproteobacteria bacterium]
QRLDTFWKFHNAFYTLVELKGAGKIMDTHKLSCAAHHVRKACESIGLNWVHGMSQCEKFFSSS